MKSVGIKPLNLRDVVVSGGFWENYLELIRTKVVTYQWEVLNDRVLDAPQSGCIKNFEIAAGRRDGEFYGMVFQDSDLYKWLECVAFCLATRPDATLEAIADEAIELIGAARGADGYINTYYTIKAPEEKWGNLQQGHELYCAGHLMEAAVAYFKATGKRAFLEIAISFADCIDMVFGLEEGKLRGYPGHQEVEIGLYKLYKVTGERRYLDLATYFIKQRGTLPHYFDEEQGRPGYVEIFRGLTRADRVYNQSHLPALAQKTAAGHAVRAVYMYAAMADLAAETGDLELAAACDLLYENIVQKQMYVTGAVGSSAWGEAFTTDFDLPSNLYGETCASVGLMMFCRRMNVLRGEARFVDVMELALYNTVLAAMSLSGTEFFYVNPLEVEPKKHPFHPGYRHAKTKRQKWFSCACCPANLARTIAGIGLYAYAACENGLYVNLYCEGEAKDEGRKVAVKTSYPFGDFAKICVSGGVFKLYLRNPGSAPVCGLKINGQAADFVEDKGYIVLERDWRGDEVEIRFDLKPRFVYSAGEVQNNAGKAAVARGPVVFCVEEVDNGPLLGSLVLGDEDDVKFAAVPEGLLEGTVALRVSGWRMRHGDGGLYRGFKPTLEACEFIMIPYFEWANRGENEMRVFLNQKL